MKTLYRSYEGSNCRRGDVESETIHFTVRLDYPRATSNSGTDNNI